MLYSLRTALLVTMLAVTMVAIGLTTLYASLTTRFEFTRFLESGRDLRNEQVQEGILRIMRQELATIEVDNAEGIINPSGTAMLASGTGFVLNPGNFRIYTLGQDNHVDLTKTRAINPSMDLRFEISSGGQTQLYEGNTRVGVVYTNPITDIEMMPAQIEFVQSVNDGIMAGALLASAVAIVVALFLSRQILQPIQALKSAAQRMEEGDFSHKVRTRARGELGELTQAFNSMRTALAHQEQLRRNMVSDIAHELRTPLTNLRGYLEALQDGFIEPNNDTINLLHDEAMLLNRLVQDLQELALVEAGQLHIHRQAVAMDDTIRQTIAIVQPMARRKDIQLTTDIADDLPSPAGMKDVSPRFYVT
jgi:signal transduction histidine kinase